MMCQELCTEQVSKSKYLLQIILSQSRDKQVLMYIDTKINYVITINWSKNEEEQECYVKRNPHYYFFWRFADRASQYIYLSI